MLVSSTVAGRPPTRARIQVAPRLASACLDKAAAMAKPPSSSMITWKHNIAQPIGPLGEGSDQLRKAQD